jgi:hypothetical protein
MDGAECGKSAVHRFLNTMIKDRDVMDFVWKAEVKKEHVADRRLFSEDLSRS